MEVCAHPCANVWWPLSFYLLIKIVILFLLVWRDTIFYHIIRNSPAHLCIFLLLILADACWSVYPSICPSSPASSQVDPFIYTPIHVSFIHWLCPEQEFWAITIRHREPKTCFIIFFPTYTYNLIIRRSRTEGFYTQRPKIEVPGSGSEQLLSPTFRMETESAFKKVTVWVSVPESLYSCKKNTANCKHSHHAGPCITETYGL